MADVKKPSKAWHVGDKAHVLKLDEIGKVTYVDRELISVKLDSGHGPRAYWRSEVEHVEEPVVEAPTETDPLEELIKENNAQGTE